MQGLHGKGHKTEAARRAIQQILENLRGLAKRYVVNHKTITHWKKRAWVCDLRTGPKSPRLKVLTIEAGRRGSPCDRRSRGLLQGAAIDAGDAVERTALDRAVGGAA